jgi:8-oxo-dGTP diphosphatase
MSADDKNRTKTRIAVYLIGVRGDTILLGKRHNTGHMDGHWSLIAGHVQEGESASNAIMREVEEECGIRLAPHELSLIGAMHHYSPPFDYVNFIFTANLNAHEPINKEPHKCEILAFYPLNDLPVPIAPYVQTIITQSITQKPWIKEYGWK